MFDEIRVSIRSISKASQAVTVNVERIMKSCSLIICTRNRAPALELTLEALQRVVVPPDYEVELILMDNGSEDSTPEVIKRARHPRMTVRRMHEGRPGKSRALNRAILAAKGEVLLFTDDDVELAENWIEGMAAPLFAKKCFATAGRIRLGEELERPWMQKVHRVLIACAEPYAESPDLVGASMGIRREVFDDVGLFDERLGPGASGFGEEGVFCNEMRRRGLRIEPVKDTHAVHHPDPSRLQRRSWLATADAIGRSEAYVMRLTGKQEPKHLWAKQWVLGLKLALRSALAGNRAPNEEGCPVWEISYRMQYSKWKHLRMYRTTVQVDEAMRVVERPAMGSGAGGA